MDKNILTSGTWQRDDDAYDPYARVRRFTFNGRQFTAHSGQAEQADQCSMTVREAVSRRYVATVSNWTALPGQLSARLDAMEPQSGYTPCACRDCMDATVSRNTNNPELCELCDSAGCVEWEQGSPAVIAWECQRDDAYPDWVGDAGTGHGASEYHSGA